MKNNKQSTSITAISLEEKNIEFISNFLFNLSNKFRHPVINNNLKECGIIEIKFFTNEAVDMLLQLDNIKKEYKKNVRKKRR